MSSVMRKSVLAVVLSAFAGGAFSQDACRAALPRLEEEKADCAPRAAAAYDFAFCSVSYYISSVAASPFPDENGESQAESLRIASDAYARVSLALSDPERVKTNVERAKRYYESLKHRPAEGVTPGLNKIGLQCQGINQHHVEVLEQVAREIRARRR